MSAELLTDLPRATDANGNPIPGAKWYFYVSGTTTPQAVYSDATLVTSLGAIVTADSGGKFVAVYLDATKSYRGVLKDSTGATTYRDIDPINDSVLLALSAATGAALIGKTGGGTVQDAIDGVQTQIDAGLAEVDTAVSNLPATVVETFGNLSASDAGQVRRASFAASVEALKANALNINGNHRISQENGTTLLTGIGAASPGQEKWTTDGHKLWVQGTLRVSAQQVSVTDLPGFSHALKVIVTTAQASIGTDFIRHLTFCESNRFLPLAWGTLKARDMVRYAWVKTSMAGTYDVNILNGDRTSVRSGTFTVDEPNSWQLVKTHIPAPTFTSTWDISSIGYRCEVALAGGTSPNLAAEVGHYFMTTGELFLPADYDPGITDTGLLMPHLQENLAACQRYYQKSYNMSTAPGTASTFAGSISKIAEASVSFLTVGDVRFYVPMVNIPTITVYSTNSGTAGKAYNSNSAADVTLTTQNPGAGGFHAYLNSVAVTAGHGLSFHYVADARIG